MKSLSILLTSTLSLLVTAVPLEERTTKGTAELATFDTIKVSTGSAVLTRPPTPYKGLIYNGITVQNNALPLKGVLPVLKPHSAPNTGLFDTLTQVTATGTPSITKASNASSPYFALHSMYAGCSVNTGLTKLPTACTIQAGTTTPNGVKHLKRFHLPASKDLTLVTFPPVFQRANHVTFILVGDLPVDAVIAAQLDDLSYTLF